MIAATSTDLRPASAALAPRFDASLLARVEQAGLNASAPPQQRMVGGWMLRLSPGKAKRARCINALAAGTVPLDEMLERAEASFAAAGLPLIVRITPFTQPATLDADLQGRGFRAYDDTRVMVRDHLDGLPELLLPDGCELQRPGHGLYADAIGAMRASPMAQRQAHAERLQASASAYSGMFLRRGGAVLACAQMALEHELVGLYDVYTVAAHRNAGLAGLLCSRLLLQARALGARSAYLQVEADNVAARAVYARLGFADAYGYHYRSKHPESA